jgi:hypothetical protein
MERGRFTDVDVVCAGSGTVHSDIFTLLSSKVRAQLFKFRFGKFHCDSYSVNDNRNIITRKAGKTNHIGYMTSDFALLSSDFSAVKNSVTINFQVIGSYDFLWIGIGALIPDVLEPLWDILNKDHGVYMIASNGRVAEHNNSSPEFAFSFKPGEVVSMTYNINTKELIFEMKSRSKRYVFNNVLSKTKGVTIAVWQE